MKKIASLLVVAFAFTLATQSQEKRKEKRPQLSLEQQTDLMVKKMTLALDLSEKQQQEITPLLKVRANERKIAMEKRKEMRKRDKHINECPRPTNLLQSYLSPSKLTM